jgi:hypothetical protein
MNDRRSSCFDAGLSGYGVPDLYPFWITSERLRLEAANSHNRILP